MATSWVDFKQIKADVAIDEVLSRYGVHLRRGSGDDLRAARATRRLRQYGEPSARTCGHARS
jgi:hypothetical protein